MDLLEIKNLAESMALEVGVGLRAAATGEESLDIKTKGEEINLVTKYDLWAEKEIVSRIRAKFPDHAIIGEESFTELSRTTGKTLQELISKGVSWVLDPIDGTSNFANRIPHFGISIGILIDGVPAVGVVYNPVRNELFSAAISHGARLNGKPIQVSKKERLLDGLIATGFPYDRRNMWQDIEPGFRSVLMACRDLRRWGAASLDICYVACGWFDGYFEYELHPWDIAAGIVVLKEAGGSLANIPAGREEDFDICCRSFMCGSGRSFEELKACFK